MSHTPLKILTSYDYVLNTVKWLSNSVAHLELHALDQIMPHRSGHYCYLLCPDGQYRPYSITNCPNETGSVELHIRVTERNKFMESLLVKRNILNIQGPYGNCTFNQEVKTPTLFLAEGVGISAFQAIFAESFLIEDCLLIWARKEDDQSYLNPTIAEWQKSITNLKIQLLDIQEPNVTQLLLTLSHSFLGQNQNSRLYFAGSPKTRKYIYEQIVASQAGTIEFFSDI